MFECLDMVDFGSSPASEARIVSRNGLRMGPALLHRCGSIKVDGSRKRLSENRVLEEAHGMGSQAACNDLVDVLKFHPSVATIVSRAIQVERTHSRGSFVKGRRTRA